MLFGKGGLVDIDGLVDWGEGDELMPVKTMMWPDRFCRIVGRVAFIMLTGPKKLVSNWERTRVRVCADAASSSTVPMTAVILPLVSN